MRTILVILGVWLLINVLFVVVMAPIARRKYPPIEADKEISPFNGSDRTSLKFTIISVAMMTLFSLSPAITDAVATVRRAFGRQPPPVE